MQGFLEGLCEICGKEILFLSGTLRMCRKHQYILIEHPEEQSEQVITPLMPKKGGQAHQRWKSTNRKKSM
jgi:hypothetical protein